MDTLRHLLRLAMAIDGDASQSTLWLAMAIDGRVSQSVYFDSFRQ